MISSLVKNVPSNSKILATNLINNTKVDNIDVNNNIQLVNGIANPLYSSFVDFFSFLDNNKIIGTTIGMVIGLQMNAFWGDFTKSIIDPISKKVIHDDINHLSFTLFEMKFYYGKVLISLINILISFFFLFQLYKLAKSFGLH